VVVKNGFLVVGLVDVRKGLYLVVLKGVVVVVVNGFLVVKGIKGFLDVVDDHVGNVGSVLTDGRSVVVVVKGRVGSQGICFT